MLEALKIIAFSVVCAVTYGILHDQVTAHVAVEYFTIAHPPVFPTDNPFWLAIGWGVIATWWVGLILGAMVAVCACFGNWPKVGLSELRRPITILMLVSGAIALFAGATGWGLTEATVPGTIGFWANEIDPDRHSRFTFAAWAHSASYLTGGIGGLVIAVRTLMQRRAIAQAASTSSTNSG